MFSKFSKPAAKPAFKPMSANVALSQRAMLATLTISRWGARKGDKKAKAEVVAAHGVEAVMIGVSKKLLSEKAEVYQTFLTLEGQARNFFREITSPWGDNNARILAATNYFKLVEGLKEFEDKWESNGIKFRSEYRDLILQAEKSLNGQANGLFNPADYPSEDRVMKKFALVYNIYPLPAAPDFRVDLGDVETERVKKSLEASMSQASEGITRDAFNRLFPLVESMTERLEDTTRTAQNLHVSSFERIGEMCDVLTTLNIMDDPAMTQMIERVKNTLSVKPKAEEERGLCAVRAAEIKKDMGAIMAGWGSFDL